MNAIIYARYSPRPGTECDSIEKQIMRCAAYCSAQRYDVIGTYEDAAISGGRADNRPGLQEALDQACEQKAVLVCYDLSRLARSTRDAIDIADRLHASGANLAFLDLMVDTASPTGRCFFTIIAAFAQMQREQIGERTSKAMRHYQANGRLMSRYAPYGYQVTDKKLVYNPVEQVVIEKIRSLKTEGYCVSEIGHRLESLGIMCRGNRWYHTTVKKILSRGASTL